MSLMYMLKDPEPGTCLVQMGAYLRLLAHVEKGSDAEQELLILCEVGAHAYFRGTGEWPTLEKVATAVCGQCDSALLEQG